MALTDPRSVIREILSRRPDLQTAFAPQLEAAGIQVAGPSFSGETRRRLDAANALRSGQAPSASVMGRPPTPPPTGFPPAPTGLSPDEQALPFGGSGGYPNSLRSMADRGDPNQAPDFRSRLTDARMLQGSARVPPGSGLAAANTNPTAYVQGQLPGNFMNPGNIPRTRPPEQLSAAGPPSPLTGSAPPSPLAGVGPSAPIIGREAPPGLNAPPSPLASRFGDQSQLPGGAFSGSLPRPPQPRPFESMIAARPMPPGGPGSLPAAPAMASGPTPPTPLQIDAAKDYVRQEASLPPVPLSPDQRINRVPSVGPESPLSPQLAARAAIAAGTAPTATAASLSPYQNLRTSLDITAGAPAPRIPQARPEITSQPLPPPSPTAAIPPANIQTGNLDDVLALSGTSPPPAMVGQTEPTIPGTRAVRAIRNAITGDNKQPVAPVNEPAPPPAQKPFWNAPNIGTGIGAVGGLVLGGLGGAAAGAGAGRLTGKLVSFLRSRGQDVDAKGNILDKAGNIIGHVSDMARSIGSGGMSGIFGSGGNSMGSGGMGMGGGGYGYSGGGGSGGQYGGGGGYNIRESIGGAYKNR